MDRQGWTPAGGLSEDRVRGTSEPSFFIGISLIDGKLEKVYGVRVDLFNMNLWMSPEFLQLKKMEFRQEVRESCSKVHLGEKAFLENSNLPYGSFSQPQNHNR
jgi:hypothetical protein